MPRGHYNHKGRPGKLGGSLPKDATNLGKLFQVLKGSSRSGNFEHQGRPGKRGGSTSNFRSMIASKMIGFDEGREYPIRNDKDIDMITDFAKAHPPGLIEKIGNIYVAFDNEDLLDAAYFKEDHSASDLNEIEMVSGLYFPFSRSIGVIIRGNQKENIRQTFDHEVGHLLWNETQRSARDGYKIYYDVKPEFGRKTDYSKTSAEESFAETYAQYIRNPASLSRDERNRIGYVLDEAGYFGFGDEG